MRKHFASVACKFPFLYDKDHPARFARQKLLTCWKVRMTAIGYGLVRNASNDTGAGNRCPSPCEDPTHFFGRPCSLIRPCPNNACAWRQRHARSKLQLCPQPPADHVNDQASRRLRLSIGTPRRIARIRRVVDRVWKGRGASSLLGVVTYTLHLTRRSLHVIRDRDIPQTKLLHAICALNSRHVILRRVCARSIRMETMMKRSGCTARIHRTFLEVRICCVQCNVLMHWQSRRQRVQPQRFSASNRYRRVSHLRSDRNDPRCHHSEHRVTRMIFLSSRRSYRVGNQRKNFNSQNSRRLCTSNLPASICQTMYACDLYSPFLSVQT